MHRDAFIETPSGKAAGDENFPVASWLLPKAVRADVKVYYLFARAVDDIADNPKLPPSEKITRLEGFAAAVNGADGDPAFAKGQAVRAMFERTGTSKRHALDLVSAFIQDATKSRYEDWTELMSYCALSAAPVGRFLLELHGEEHALHPPADALSSALQVINHLQDCAKDYAALDRVYLPARWMAAEGAAVSDLALPAATPPLRRVLDRALAETRGLLQAARQLPKAIRHPRLAAETAVILSIADELVSRLFRKDPLAERVTLGPLGSASAATAGLIRLWI